MEKIIFKVKNNPNITFVGKEVAYCHDQDDDLSHRIYETQKGAWFYAALTNEDILLRHKIIDNKSAEELVKVLGHSDLAKNLYEQLDIDTTKNLDI